MAYPNVRLKCYRCRDMIPEEDFFKIDNGIAETLHICKNCCVEIVDNHILNDKDTIYEALYKLCGVTGVLYNRNLVNGIIPAAMEKEGSTINLLRQYFRSLRLPQYKGKSFLDSDFATIEDLRKDKATVDLIEHISANVVKWGEGYTKEDYKRLNELYAQWASGTPQDTITQKSLTKDLCKIDLKLEKAAVKGGEIKDLLNQKQSLIKALAIDPQTLIKNRQDNEAIESFGAWVAEIEKTSPAEYLQDPSVYFDVNGIEEYWNKHIKRPLKNLLLGTKDFPNINDADN